MIRKGAIVCKSPELTLTSVLYYVCGAFNTDIFCIRTSPLGLMSYNYVFKEDELNVIKPIVIETNKKVIEALNSSDRLIPLTKASEKLFKDMDETGEIILVCFFKRRETKWRKYYLATIQKYANEKVIKILRHVHTR